MSISAILAASTRPIPSGTVTCLPSIVSVTCFDISLRTSPHHLPMGEELMRKIYKLLFYRVFKILWESFDAGHNCHGGKLSQCTQTFALHLLGNIQKQIHIT